MNLRRFAAVGNLLIAAVLMLAVWALLAWVASRPALKSLIDLTPQAVNSIAPATEDLLAELREQRCAVEFHLFFPPMQGQAQDDYERQLMAIRSRLRELTTLLLRRYVFLGGESVVLVEHDLYGDPASARDAAQKFGVTEPADMVVVAIRQPGKERRFKKLSLLADLAEIELPELQRSPVPGVRVSVPTLKDYKGEVAISSAMKSLLVQGVPVAYVLHGYSPGVQFDDRVVGSAYGLFLQNLVALGFEVRSLTFQRQKIVPADATVVIVLEPTQEFPETEAQALFAYVQRGGRLFLNYSWSGQPDWNIDGGRLGELLGYQIGRQPVFHLIPDYSGQSRGPGLDGNDGVAKLQLQVNPNHPVTRRIAESARPLQLGGAREIRERAEPVAHRKEPLLRTGPHGWLGVEGPDGRPDNRRPGIALRAFDVGLSIEVPNVVAGERPGQVIVVSGVFANNVGYPYFGDLANNICNWMAERAVLLDIQGNRYRLRAMELQPQQQARTATLLIWGVPGTFLALGLLVFFVRRRQ